MMTNKTILIVEDSPTQAQFCSLILEDAGYQVCVAGTGQLGISAVETTPIDMIILDIILPDMDGYQVCSHIRQMNTSYIPILMATAEKMTVEDKVDGLAAGADDYINKPFDPRELLARVSALLRIKQMVDDLLSHLSNEHQAYQSLRRIALTDHLTNLYNRHYFAEALEREFALAQRHNFFLSCIMSDIDMFRNFNNQFGHSIGDFVLKESAQILSNNLRQGDIIARFGGEEFVILLPMTDLAMAVALAERLRSLIDEQVWKSPAGDLHINISFGVATMPNSEISTPDHLIQCADKALYKAKGRGRNRVEFFDPSIDQNIPIMD